MSDDSMTEQQAQEIMRQFSAGKQNVHSFFTDIIKAEDTTKVGNLSEDELGTPKLPVRTYKELEVFCNHVGDEDGFKDYFKDMAEVQTSTSLSKDGTLIKLSVTNKKELADVTPVKKKNKGWFNKGGTTQNV